MFKYYFVPIILISFVVFSFGVAQADETASISDGGASFSAPFTPTIPTQGLPTDLGQLIEQIFTWSLAVLGIAVFVMVFYAGFLWLTAAGNTAKVTEAKSRITNAVFGAIILLSAYLILYTINPDFVRNSVNLPGLESNQTQPGQNQPNSPSSNRVCVNGGCLNGVGQCQTDADCQSAWH